MNQAPMCDNCGHIMVREQWIGGGFKCLNCGGVNAVPNFPPDEVLRVQLHEHFEVKADFGPVEKKSSIGGNVWPCRDQAGIPDIELSAGECPFCPVARFHRSICNGCRRDRRRPLPLEERVVFEESLGATPLGFVEWGWKVRDPATYMVALGPTREEAFKQLRKRIDELESAHAVIPGEHAEDFSDPEPYRFCTGCGAAVDDCLCAGPDYDPEGEAEDEQEPCAECDAYDCFCVPAQGFFISTFTPADRSACEKIRAREASPSLAPTFRSCFDQLQRRKWKGHLNVYYFGPPLGHPVPVCGTGQSDYASPVEIQLVLQDRSIPQRFIDEVIEGLYGPPPGQGRRFS